MPISVPTCMALLELLKRVMSLWFDNPIHQKARKRGKNWPFWNWKLIEAVIPLIFARERQISVSLTPPDSPWNPCQQHTAQWHTQVGCLSHRNLLLSLPSPTVYLLRGKQLKCRDLLLTGWTGIKLNQQHIFSQPHAFPPAWLHIIPAGTLFERVVFT